MFIDYRVPTPLFYRQFHAELNDLSEVNSPYIVSDNRFQVFTGGSRQRKGVGAVVYTSQLGVNMCFKLPDECSILQAEIMAILRAVKWLRYHKIYGNIADSLARSGAAEHTDIFCGLPLSACKNSVELFLINKSQVLWNNEHTRLT